MIKSDTIAKIADALSKFQADVQDPAKNSDNPFFKSKYVELDDLLASVRPVLSKHGLAVIQEPSGEEKVCVKTIILHNSGEFIEFEPVVLKPVKTDPQGVGSAITYGRRYALSSILGVAWDADDDGNKASGKDKNDGHKATLREAQEQIADQKTHEHQGQKSSEIKWDSFWQNVKNFGLTEDQVHVIASEVFGKEVKSLNGVINSQLGLNRFTSELRKRSQKTA
jgi:hypothetical protein